MRYANCMKTAIGGLSLVLVLSACSSGSKSQKTAAASSPSTTEASSPKPKASAVPQDMPRSDVVSDRGTTIGPSYTAIDYPSDRTGPSDRSPEITAACPSRTDAQGKVVFDDPSCPDRYRRQAGGISDKDHAGLAAACPSRVDASGKAVYDDPTCPDRFRRQVSEKDRAVLAAACPSRIDTSGNTVYVYDDPTCPRRYRHQISSIREARISLSRAAGIKKWDEPSAVAEKERAALAAACPSQVDATGKSVYDDPSCPDRYRRQKENIDDRAALVAACSSHVDATGKIIYDDPACLTRNRYLAQESAYYDRYIDKAVKHARTAEIAANQGNVPDMLENAQLSLEHAKEARRAGNNADLAAGILALRQTIAYGQGQGNDVTTTTVSRSRTVKGELSRGEKSSRVGGGEQYVVRDNQNREMPISLSPEMSRQVQVGDVVEAQVDSNGQVTSITKAQ